MSESPDFFIQKTLESYDLKITALMGQVKELKEQVKTLGLDARAFHFQSEVLLSLLVEKKQIITEEEIHEAIREMYDKIQAAAVEAGMTDDENEPEE